MRGLFPASLDLPALKTDFLNEIPTNHKGVVKAVPIPPKKHLLQLLLEKALFRTSVRMKPDLGDPVSHTVMLVPRTSQYAKQMRVAPLSPMARAIFHVSTNSRGFEGPPQDIRIRLAG